MVSCSCNRRAVPSPPREISLSDKVQAKSIRSPPLLGRSVYPAKNRPNPTKSLVIFWRRIFNDLPCFFLKKRSEYVPWISTTAIHRHTLAHIVRPHKCQHVCITKPRVLNMLANVRLARCCNKLRGFCH